MKPKLDSTTEYEVFDLHAGRCLSAVWGNRYRPRQTADVDRHGANGTGPDT